MNLCPSLSFNMQGVGWGGGVVLWFWKKETEIKLGPWMCVLQVQSLFQNRYTPSVYNL